MRIIKCVGTQANKDTEAAIQNNGRDIQGFLWFHADFSEEKIDRQECERSTQKIQ